MLRLYFVQLWYNFSDEGTEDALYDMLVLARFVGIDLTSERVVRLLSVASLKKRNPELPIYDRIIWFYVFLKSTFRKIIVRKPIVSEVCYLAHVSRGKYNESAQRKTFSRDADESNSQ